MRCEAHAIVVNDSRSRVEIYHSAMGLLYSLLSRSTVNATRLTTVRTRVAVRSYKLPAAADHKPRDETMYAQDKQVGARARVPAASDFRSDVVTTPTPAMLAAISSATLLDDVFEEDQTTIDLQTLIASLTGKESALLVPSGTMGNQVSIRSSLGGPPHGILTDHRSHILEWEAGGIAAWCGALVKGVNPANGHHLTLEDVRKHAVISQDVHACPTALISLENTLDGGVLPLDECRRISAWAREHGIHVHLDGARLWEAVASGAGSLRDFAACFDSATVCFSKGLGAPVGSMIVGSTAFCRRARHVRKMMGGGLRQAGLVAAPARVAVEKTFLGGTLDASHRRAKEVESIWTSLGGRTTRPVETNMVWLDLEAAGIDGREFARRGQEAGLRIGGERLVVHYQIDDEAVERFVTLANWCLAVS